MGEEKEMWETENDEGWNKKANQEGAFYLHDDDLELVGNFWHEGGDLLHESVDGGLISGFEQRGDGQSGDGPVHVRDQVLQIQIASRHRRRMTHGNLMWEVGRGFDVEDDTILTDFCCPGMYNSFSTLGKRGRWLSMAVRFITALSRFKHTTKWMRRF